MKFQTLKDVAAAIKLKYSTIKDLELVVYSEGIIVGGFHKINFLGRANEFYFLYELRCSLGSKNGKFPCSAETLEEAYDYLDNLVQERLKKKKEVDEYIANNSNQNKMNESLKKFRDENKGKWVWYNGAMGIDTALVNNYIEDTREQAIEAMAWHDNVTTEEVENNYDNWYYILPVEEILDEYLIDFLSDEK